MDKNQKINCNVNSCKYNDRRKGTCTLKQITVEPTPSCDTEFADESLCGNYEYRNQ